MAKVRARPETGMLYLDFFYRSIRCREQTALPDTTENRRRVQTLMNRIDKEIRQGLFDYAATFPNSPKAASLSTPERVSVTGPAPTVDIAPKVASAASRTPDFTDFSNLWREEMAPQWRRAHRRSVDAIFDAHLLPAFGTCAFASLTKADVLAFRGRLANLPGRTSTKLSATTINKIMGILRQVLMEASERFGLPDVFKGIKRIKARRPDVLPFSLNEVERIRDSIREDFRDYVTVRFFTGMRTGEINGLKWKHVDFTRGQILVRETYAAGEAEENAKTESSLRDIPMVPLVREALEHQFEVRRPDCEYVFCTRDGYPIDAHNFTNRIWYPLLRFLGIERRRPYQTRHTTATLMLAAGENPEWIARLMGHANTQMLFTVYSRFVPNLTRQDGLAFAGLIGERTAEAPRAPALTSDAIDAMDAATLRKMLKAALAPPDRRRSRTASKENTHV